MRCHDNAILRKPLPEVCKTYEIGTVPQTNGPPAWTPSPDQLPLAHDYNSNILYFYTTEWKQFGLSSLREIDLSNLANLENVLRIPVSYVSAGRQVEGYVTLKELKSLIGE